MTNFKALETSIAMIRSLRTPLSRIRRLDPDLARQLRRALVSIALNLSEGRKRTGRDRMHHWRIASGSLDEARMAMRIAEALGYLSLDGMRESLTLIDRAAGLLWGFVH